MVECRQKDADGILVFVSPPVGIHGGYLLFTDQSTLCCQCCASFCDRSGPEVKQSGYLYLGKIRCLGELTLILEPDYEP